MTLSATTTICPQCSTELAPSLLACPTCGRLAHADRLRDLAQRAQVATNANDLTTALAAWREALELLPEGSRQHQVISDRIIELSRALDAGTSPTAPQTKPGDASAGKKAAAGLGAIGLLLLKFKTLLLVLLTKGKLLLLGLGKASTLFSMLVSFSVYWTIWGWRFALGFVLSIYIHEMGHVIALRRYGFRATAPMFIPGLGAFIRLQQKVVDPREDAIIGLAGPLYGFGASLLALALWAATRQPILIAIASVNAWINLFNLLPVWTLDGARAFHALSRVQRLTCAAGVFGAYLISHDGFLILLAIVCAMRSFEREEHAEGDNRSMCTYAGLALLLSLILLLRPVHAISG